MSILTRRPHLVLNKVSMGVFISRVNLDYNSSSTQRRYMNKEKNRSPSQGLNLGLPPEILGIRAVNITTSLVILIVHKSILY